jgi:hypothetical protein
VQLSAPVGDRVYQVRVSWCAAAHSRDAAAIKPICVVVLLSWVPHGCNVARAPAHRWPAGGTMWPHLASAVSSLSAAAIVIPSYCTVSCCTCGGVAFLWLGNRPLARHVLVPACRKRLCPVGAGEGSRLRALRHDLVKYACQHTTQALCMVQRESSRRKGLWDVVPGFATSQAVLGTYAGLHPANTNHLTTAAISNCLRGSSCPFDISSSCKKARRQLPGLSAT